MKKLYSLILLLAVFVSAFAQITLSTTDMPTVPSTLYNGVDTLPTGMTLGQNGANRTWNFAAALRHLTDTVRHVLPSSTAYASNFQNATDAVTLNNVNYGFFKNSATLYECQGLAGDLLNTGSPVDVTFSPKLDVFRFPVTYGNKYSSSYGFVKDVAGSSVGQPGVDRIRVTFTANFTDTIDAWGSLTTPIGTYNTIREKRVETNRTVVETRLLSFLPYSVVSDTRDTTYTYTWLATITKGAVLTATVSKTTGAITRITYSLTPPPAPPVADFTSSNPYGGFVQFTNTSTGNPTSYAWTFGDGGTSTGASPDHTYAANGTYNVCLIATNANGSDTTCKNVVVSGIFNTAISGPSQRCSNQRTAVGYTAILRPSNTYSWTATGGTITTGAGTAAVTVNWNASGPYNLRLIECNSTGQFCDTANLSITILPVVTNTVNQTICFGQSYLGYSATGTYTDTYTAANSCDSVRTLNLTVRPQNSTVVNVTVCPGGSYQGYTTSGTYTDLFQDVNGCDSTRVLNFNVRAANITSINASICPGSSYAGHTTSGIYTDNYTDVNGCDSARTVNLTVQASIVDTLNLSICNGNSYYGYTTSGNYNDTFTVSGCDSIRVLNLTVLTEIFDTVYYSICSGNSYLGYLAAGNYNDTYTSSGGCDSTRTLFLTVLQPTSATVNQTICFGDTYLGYNATGTYTNTYTGANGCDSVRTLNLTVLPQNTTTISESICSGDSYYGHTATGLYTDTLTDINGCDSIRTVNLNVQPVILTFGTQTICSGQSFEGYSATGVYLDTFMSFNGCDSLRELTLTVSAAILETGSAIICDGESVNGHTATGVYNDTFTVAGGCDSVYVLNLTVEMLPVVPAIVAVNNELSVPDTFATYQWYQNGTLLVGAEADTFVATSNGNYTVVVSNAAGCENSSAVFNVTGISIGEVGNPFDVQIYPNPAQGFVTLSLSNNVAADYTLYNSLGQLLQSGSIVGNGIVDMQTYTQGVYYLKVQAGGAVFTQKVLLTK
jgi:PKD repeat protein